MRDIVVSPRELDVVDSDVVEDEPIQNRHDRAAFAEVERKKRRAPSGLVRSAEAEAALGASAMRPRRRPSPDGLLVVEAAGISEVPASGIGRIGDHERHEMDAKERYDMNVWPIEGFFEPRLLTLTSPSGLEWDQISGIDWH